MARLALGIAGAAIGSYFGQPQIGWMIGSMIGGAIEAANAPSAQGPRLDDLTVQSAAYGQAIPVIYGSLRVAGNMIWSTGLIERKKTEDSGGKGGGGEITNYSYSASFAIALCEGPIDGILRVWADGKLVYDVNDTNSAEGIMQSRKWAEKVNLYLGSETQTADPLIESYEGAGNVPAHRGVAYFVAENWPLADYGNRIPNITAEIIQSGTESAVKLEDETFSPPIGAAEQNGSGLGFLSCFCPLPADNGAWICWSPDSDPGDVYIYRSFPSGQHFYERFLDNTKSAVIEHLWGISDVPCWMVRVPGFGITDVKLYLIDAENSSYTLSLTSAQESAGYDIQDFDGVSFHLKNDVLFVYDYGYQGILRWENFYNNSEHYAVEIIASTGNVQDVCVSDNYIYGLMADGSNELVKWDHDGTEISRTVLTPTTAFSLGHNTNRTELFAESDDIIYIQSYVANTAPTVHVVESGVYRQIGLLPTPSTNSLRFGWAVRDGLLVKIGWHNSSATSYRWTAYNLESLSNAGYALDDVVSEILLRSDGLEVADIDMSALSADTVTGFSIARPTPSRQLLQQLMQAYYFDIIETDWQLVAVQRGGASARTIDEEDLAARIAGDAEPDTLPVTRAQDRDLPRRLEVHYLNTGQDYQPGMQYAQRQVTASQSITAVQLAIAMDDDTAAQIADTLLLVVWKERDSYEISVGIDQIDIDPSDIITITRTSGSTLTLRVIESELTAPAMLRITAVPEDSDSYTSAAVGAAAQEAGQTLQLAGPTILHLLDIPPLQDSDASLVGHYAAATGYLSGWPGCEILKSTDGGATWQSVTIATPTTTIGVCESVLGDGPTTIFDEENTLTVSMISGTLSSSTEANVLDGANAALVGADGRWELIQFVTATLNADGTYTLSQLLRGRKGTEANTGNHADNDRIIFVNTDTIGFIANNISELDISRTWKGATFGQPLQEVNAQSFAWGGELLRPYSPADAELVYVGDLRKLTWKSRCRYTQEWQDSFETPLDSEIDHYEVDSENSAGAVIDTLNTDTDEFCYLAGSTAPEWMFFIDAAWPIYFSDTAFAWNYLKHYFEFATYSLGIFRKGSPFGVADYDVLVKFDSDGVPSTFIYLPPTYDATTDGTYIYTSHYFGCYRYEWSGASPTTEVYNTDEGLRGIVYDADTGDVWAARPSTAEMVRLNTDLTVVAEYNVGFPAYAIDTFTGSSHIYACNPVTNQVNLITKAAGAVSSTFSCGNQPVGISAFTTSKLYIHCVGDRKLEKRNTAGTLSDDFDVDASANNDWPSTRKLGDVIALQDYVMDTSTDTEIARGLTVVGADRVKIYAVSDTVGRSAPLEYTL